MDNPPPKGRDGRKGAEKPAAASRGAVFPSILVPLDGSHVAARSLGCAVWLASRLGARLHILSATHRQLPVREELRRLGVPEADWPLVTLHQAPQYPSEAILAAVARHDVRLIVMAARGESAEALSAEEPVGTKLVGRVARSVIERSAVPVLLLPPNYHETLPWERFLVPLSGEIAGDEALALAVRLANLLELEVHVVHVANGDSGGNGLAAKARYADALHHEYSHQMEELVSRALPQCSAAECRCIAGVALCRGDIAAELMAHVERKRISVLAVGWHGRFMTGHAQVLKHLVEVITTPVLLVKPAGRLPFRLVVGEEIE